MNYIKELNTFYDWLETNSLSTSAIALWHALMHINNKAGWAEEFTVAASVLCIKTGLSDRTIRNARNELKQRGRIDWKTRKGNQAAIYEMISLFDNVPVTIAGNRYQEDKSDGLPEINAGNVSGNTSGNASVSVSGNASTLNKLNETKLDLNTTSSTESNPIVIDNEFSELARLYQKAGFEVNGFTSEWLQYVIEKYSYEWVKNAILEAERQGARKKPYLEKILNNWKTWGGMKLSTDKRDGQPKIVAAKKTRFHNFEGRSESYSNDQMEAIIAKKRREDRERRQGESKLPKILEK